MNAEQHLDDAEIDLTWSVHYLGEPAETDEPDLQRATVAALQSIAHALIALGRRQ